MNLFQTILELLSGVNPELAARLVVTSHQSNLDDLFAYIPGARSKLVAALTQPQRAATRARAEALHAALADPPKPDQPASENSWAEYCSSLHARRSELAPLLALH